jgi:hypothetical protein
MLFNILFFGGCTILATVVIFGDLFEKSPHPYRMD